MTAIYDLTAAEARALAQRAEEARRYAVSRGDPIDAAVHARRRDLYLRRAEMMERAAGQQSAPGEVAASARGQRVIDKEILP